MLKICRVLRNEKLHKHSAFMIFTYLCRHFFLFALGYLHDLLGFLLIPLLCYEVLHF